MDFLKIFSRLYFFLIINFLKCFFIKYKKTRLMKVYKYSHLKPETLLFCFLSLFDFYAKVDFKNQ